MFEVHIYLSVTSAFPKESEKLYGYVLECTGKTRTVEGFGKITATYHKTVLIALIEAFDRINQSCEVHIHTENEFILNMLQKNAHKWAEKGFVTKKGTPIANQEEWQQLWSLASKHNVIPEPGTHQFDKWIKDNAEAWLKKAARTEKP